MKVYVVVCDYGLNGAGCLGVFTERPTDEQVRALEEAPVEPGSYPHTSVTGFSGATVVEVEVA